MAIRRWSLVAVSGLVACMLLLPATVAEDAAPRKPPGTPQVDGNSGGPKGPAEPIVFERVRVLGAPETIDKIPGSVSYVDKKQLAEQDYADIHRILRRVPGVNLQEEEGYGLRPNIGMRGSGVERSSKITTLEDGVLIAPAPYSAPSAYYFPTAGRMEGIEVSKGPSAIRDGPFTTGGVLNFVSTSIPSDFGGELKLAVGNNETWRGRLNVGDSKERFGWVFETYQLDTAGFKNLDGGGDTGFDLEDYMVKFRVNSSAAAPRYQALEIKAGKTRQFGNETYLGLTQDDFDVDPYRRYAGSQQDTIDTDHEQIQARYLVHPSDRVDLTATVYRNDFFRNWHKLQSVGGVEIGDVLADPSTYGAELDVLRGTPGATGLSTPLMVRNNRRDYYSQGVQVTLGLTPGGDGSTHDVEVSARYHEDEEDRFQAEDRFRMTSTGSMVLDGLGLPGSQANRVSSADSLALFVRDTISVGPWTIVPGVRFETINFQRIDYDDPARTTVGGSRQHGVDEFIPGVGVSYRIDPRATVFGGIHRGFAPPGPSATDADAEQSTNYEFGYRRNQGSFTFGAVGFFNDYSNLLGACTVSSGCSSADVGDLFDGGEVEVLGLEAEVGYDVGAARSLAHGLPISLTYTATRAEFRNAFDSDYAPWGSVAVGDELPYLPEHQATLGVGVVDPRWSVFVNVVYVGQMRTVAGQGPIARDESTGAHLLVDLSAKVSLHKNLKAFVQARNLTDETYVAARRPAGVRPGIDRTVLGGISCRF